MTSERAVDGWEELRREIEALPREFCAGDPPVAVVRRAAALAIVDRLAAARGEPPEPAGTETRCPLEGVHEHAFRGPHRFHEWEPGT